MKILVDFIFDEDKTLQVGLDADGYSRVMLEETDCKCCQKLFYPIDSDVELLV